MDEAKTEDVFFEGFSDRGGDDDLAGVRGLLLPDGDDFFYGVTVPYISDSKCKVVGSSLSVVGAEYPDHPVAMAVTTGVEQRCFDALVIFKIAYWVRCLDATDL